MDEVVATLSLVALILVLFSSTLTYLAYVLAGIAYSLLECGASTWDCSWGDCILVLV